MTDATGGSASQSAVGRTDLAWVRSALAFGGVGAAMLKNLAPVGRARPVEGAIAISLGVAVVAEAKARLVHPVIPVAHLGRHRRSRSDRGGHRIDRLTGLLRHPDGRLNLSPA
jgi:uncharacterized membrane protein YidH (DUF202 family)